MNLNCLFVLNQKTSTSEATEVGIPIRSTSAPGLRHESDGHNPTACSFINCLGVLSVSFLNDI